MFNAKSLLLFYKERYIFLFFTASVLLIAASLLWSILQVPFTKQLIPLHYDIFFGIDRIGSWYELFLYPAIALLVTKINFLIGYRIFPKDKYLSYYLGLMSFVCSGCTFLYLFFLRLHSA